MAVAKGTAMWASIVTPNTKYQPEWSVDLVLDDAELVEKFRSTGHTVKTQKDGQETLKFKRRVNKAKGGQNNPPRLLDINKNPIDVQVGNGSKIAVQYSEYSGDYNGKPYFGLELKAVQVLDLVTYGGEDGSEFEVVDADEEF